MNRRKETPEDPARIGHLLADDPNLHRFSREAMACVFGIFLLHPDKTYAHQAACEALDQLASLEQALSRYIENSEVNRINRLAPGEAMLLEDPVFECIGAALEACQLTGGAFDIDYLSAGAPDRRPLDENLRLDAESMTIAVLLHRVSLDLGGIGKGFALDVMARCLREWSIPCALLQGGSSSILAYHDLQESARGWPLHFILPEKENETVYCCCLRDSAVGASGLFKGPHIINPQTGKTAGSHVAVWSHAPNAALGDALSTGAMNMTEEQIRELCENRTDIGILRTVYHPQTGVVSQRAFGRFPEH